MNRLQYTNHITWPRLGALAAILAGSLLFAHTLVHAVYYAPEKEIPEVKGSLLQPAATSTPSNYPIQLIIPKIGVHADIEHTGISYTGNMRAPDNFTDVGWYRYGTIPGHLGSSVIAGHVDNGIAMDGVFKHLKDLRPGDDVYVHTKDGKKLHFIVEEIESYPYNSAPLERIFNTHDGTAHLNLITCDGTWLPSVQTNDRRLVVYTTLVHP